MTTTTMPLETKDLSAIAGGYLRVISAGEGQPPTGDECTFDLAASALLSNEARELSVFVAQRRVYPSMIPYHFSSFGFGVAMAALNHPPREAIEEIRSCLERTKSAIRATIDDAKRSNFTIDGDPA